METEHRSAISVLFVLLLVGTMTAVAVAPGPAAKSAGQPVQEPARTAGQTGTATATPDEATTVTVSATGDVLAEPDRAVLTFESTGTATTPQAATERLARNTSRLRTALLNANLSADQIRTTGYGLDEISDRDGTPTRNDATRYRARQTTVVEVSNTSRVGELIDVAVGNGATAVLGVEFRLSEERRSELRNRALREATESARTQAETLAATEGLRLTGVRSISTGSADVQPFVSRETALASDAGTRIDPGPVTVEATVEVTYAATE